MNNSKLTKGLLLAVILGLGGACKKAAPTATTAEPQSQPQLPMPAPPGRETPDPSKTRADMDAEMDQVLAKEYPGNPAAQEEARSGMKALDALGDAQEKLEEINQRTMVIPAPAGFKPEPVARKVRLNLVLEKQRIRAGEEPRFRLELTNVGRETITYQEYSSSIFKGGSILYSIHTIRFYLIDESGNKTKLHPALGVGKAEPIRELPPTADPEKRMREINALSQASTTFRVRLQPGDTLRSLGDGDSAAEAFRTFQVNGGFKKPGKFRLMVELDDRPKPLKKRFGKSVLKPDTLAKIQEEETRLLKEALGPVSAETDLEVER